MNFERRTFFQLCSACAAFLAGGSKQQAQSAPQARREAVKHRKNFVAIQVRPYAWIDEGIDSLLDNIQNKGGVNTIWAYTYDYAVARMSRGGSIPLPDHGRPPATPALWGVRSTTTTRSISRHHPQGLSLAPISASSMLLAKWRPRPKLVAWTSSVGITTTRPSGQYPQHREGPGSGCKRPPDSQSLFQPPRLPRAFER